MPKQVFCNDCRFITKAKNIVDCNDIKLRNSTTSIYDTTPICLFNAKFVKNDNVTPIKITVLKEFIADDPLIKNKNNDCKDFKIFLLNHIFRKVFQIFFVKPYF